MCKADNAARADSDYNINYIKSHIPMWVRKQGKEDEHAHYKSDFGNFCCFCNTEKRTEGFAMSLRGSNKN